jgi:site-specific DNA recombinase
MSKARKIEQFQNLTNPYQDRVGLVYARVSTPKQVTEGNGLESQEGRCVKELLSMNVPYEKSFLDAGVSGGIDFMERPAMRGLLEYIDDNPHKKFVVIFDDLKRFARHVEFHFQLKLAFKLRGVILRCLNFNFDDTPEGEFIETILAGSSQLERKQNTRQVVQKQKARLDKGYWAFGSKKGYTMTPHPVHGMISVPNAEGAILKEGLELFANRSLLKKIDLCRFLVEKGFWKKQSPERYIDKITLILKDPFYCGDIEYPEWDVARRQGHHEGLISSDTFGLIQKIIHKENSGKRIRNDISEDFKLRGLITCDFCKSHMTGAWSKGRTQKYAYYICHNKACSNKGKSVRADAVEKGFLELLKKQHLKDEVDVLLVTIFDRVWQEEVEVLRKQEEVTLKHKKEMEAKLQKLTDAIFSTSSDTLRRLYERQAEELAMETEDMNWDTEGLFDASIPYRTALDKSKKLLKSPYFAWQSLKGIEQQRLFFFIFEEKLSYNQKTGYRTDNLPSVVRLFEEFVTSNTQDVDPRGVEPRPIPCHGIVLPLYYGPD